MRLRLTLLLVALALLFGTTILAMSDRIVLHAISYSSARQITGLLSSAQEEANFTLKATGVQGVTKIVQGYLDTRPIVYFYVELDPTPIWVSNNPQLSEKELFEQSKKSSLPSRLRPLQKELKGAGVGMTAIEVGGVRLINFNFGMFQVGVKLQTIIERETIPYGWLLLAALFAFVAGIGVSLFFVRRELLPLEQLAEDAKRVAEKREGAIVNLRRDGMLGRTASMLRSLSMERHVAEQQLVDLKQMVRARLAATEIVKPYLDALFWTLPEGVVLIDKEAQVELINDRFNQLLPPQGQLAKGEFCSRASSKWISELLGRSLARYCPYVSNGEGLIQGVEGSVSTLPLKEGDSHHLIGLLALIDEETLLRKVYRIEARKLSGYRGQITAICDPFIEEWRRFEKLLTEYWTPKVNEIGGDPRRALFQLHDSIRSAIASALYLKQLSTDFFKLYSIKAWEYPLTSHPVSIPLLLDEVAHTLKPLFERESLRLLVHREGEAMEIESDHLALFDLTVALVLSVWLTTGQGTLSLRAIRLQRAVELVVEGADPFLELEDRFFFFDPLTSAGTGVHRLLVAELAKRLGGRALVEVKGGVNLYCARICLE